MDELTDVLSRFVLYFLLIELALLPLRDNLISFLEKRLPPGFFSVWECTAMDAVALYTAFVMTLEGSRERKFLALIFGNVSIQIFNGIRVALTLAYPSPLVHDLVFRGGMVVFLVVLSYFTLHFVRRE